jgi:hypothetical protein
LLRVAAVRAVKKPRLVVAAGLVEAAVLVD